MSASTNTVPAQLGFGRLPSAFAALALVIILAVAVAIVALGSTKAAPVVDSGAKGAPPPAIIDHGWSSAQYYNPAIPYVPTTPFNDHGWSSMTYTAPAIPEGTSPYGGFGGPRSAPVYAGDKTKDDKFIQNRHEGGSLPGQRMRPQ